MTFVIKREGRGFKPFHCPKPLPPTLYPTLPPIPLNCHFNNPYQSQLLVNPTYRPTVVTAAVANEAIARFEVQEPSVVRF